MNASKKYWRGLAADFDSADIALFGICADKHCSIGRGAAKAPDVMRKCSAYLPPVTMDGAPIGMRLADLGNVFGYEKKSIEAMMEKACRKPFVVALGGDHSVSIFTQKVFAIKYNRVGLVHIDAHADICDCYDGSHYSHACVVRRALENGFSPNDVCMLGIRSYEQQEVDFLNANFVEIKTADGVREAGVENVLNRLCEKFKGYDALYLSFDIDSVDPAFAPGTGTPEAMGLTPKEVRDLLCGIARRLPVRMMDIVEVSPPLDCNNITSWLALKLLLEVIFAIEEKNK